MTRYVVVNGIGSDKILYVGCDEDAATKALGECGREMYEISLNKVSKHGLFIERSIFLSNNKNRGGGIRIHRNVLDALLGDGAKLEELVNLKTTVLGQIPIK